MSTDDLHDRVRTFVAKSIGVSPERIQADTDIVGDFGAYGDDVWDMIEAFGKEFSVDLTGFRWYHHSGPEGCNPLWLFYRPWWARKPHIAIRLSDLVES